MKRRIVALAAAFALCLAFSVCAWAEESADDKWYLERAEALKDEIYELVSFEGYAEYYTSSGEALELIASWKLAMESEPKGVTGYDMPGIGLLLESMPEEYDLPDAMLKRLERSMASVMVAQINGMQGVHFLAASSVPQMTEGYVRPEDFRPCVIVYEYEGICVCVSFAEMGEDVVAATAQFCAPEIAQLLAAQ